MSKIDRRGFLIHAGAATGGAVLLHLTSRNSEAYTFKGSRNRFSPSAPASSQTQQDWRFCNKCQTIFFDGYTDKGHCPAGGGHVAAGFNFILPHDVAETPNAQKNWRFCNKCHEMFFDGYADKGRCAAGGGHVAAGFGFVLPHDVAETSSSQRNWRFCNKCNAMFFDGYPSKGRCPRDDDSMPEKRGGSVPHPGHVAAGFGFVLPHVNNGAALPDDIHLRSDITTQDWAPIGGWVDVRVNNQGHFTVTGSMHNSGLPNIQYALAVVLMTPSGAGYGFAREHQVDGTVTIIGRQRTDDWNKDETHPEVAAKWSDVSQGRLYWRLVASDTLSAGLAGLVGDIIKDVAKEYGKKAVIALVSLI